MTPEERDRLVRLETEMMLLTKQVNNMAASVTDLVAALNGAKGAKALLALTISASTMVGGLLMWVVQQMARP